MQRLILAAVMALAFSSQAYAFKPKEEPPVGEPRWELLKCTSAKSGTLWASFGHLIRSGEDKMTYFATEVVLFGKDITAREVFLDYKDGLKVPVRAAWNKFAMEYTVTKDGRTQTHAITLVQYPELKHSFLGNWKTSEAGQEDIYDQVFCSLH